VSVHQVLDKLGVEYRKIEHPPFLTCQDVVDYGIHREGLQCKNLFVRNKDKSKFYLVILPAAKRADLKVVQELLWETRLSFASEEDLAQKLGVCRGATSLLSAMNIKDSNVTVIVDGEVMRAESVAFHPNVNTETLVFAAGAIPKILNYSGAGWKEVEL